MMQERGPTATMAPTAAGRSPLEATAPLYTDASFAASGVSAGASAGPSRSAAVCGLGTGFGAREDVWKREMTQDGRIYYFNRATGGSQWHLPNHLYEQSAADSTQKASQFVAVFPTHAKAMQRVDCVTEVPAGKTSADTMNTGPSYIGMQAVEALESDPHNLHKIVSVLPQDFGDMLQSPMFQEECERRFNETAQDIEQLSFDECSPPLWEIFNAFEMQSLLPQGPRLKQLANCFDTSGMGQVDMQDFISFARFVVAVSYLEHFMDEE